MPHSRTITCSAVKRPANQLTPRIGLSRNGVSGGVAFAATHERTAYSVIIGTRNAIAYGRMYFRHGSDHCQFPVSKLLTNTQAINSPAATSTAMPEMYMYGVGFSHQLLTKMAASRKITAGTAIAQTTNAAPIRAVGTRFFTSSTLNR